MDPQAITANRLRDGYVVFLAPGGRWTAALAEAALAENEAALEALVAAAEAAMAANEVVGAYPIGVAHGPDGPHPVRYREWLRTRGPSVRPDVGYQAAAGRSARHAVA